MRLRTHIQPVAGSEFETAWNEAVSKANTQGHVYFVVGGLRIARDQFGYYFKDDAAFALPVGRVRIEGARITRVSLEDTIEGNPSLDGFYQNFGATATVTTEPVRPNNMPQYDETVIAVTGRSWRGVTRLYNAIRSGEGHLFREASYSNQQ